MAYPGFSKWKAIPTEYNGVKYPSKLEAHVAMVLDEAMARGKIKKVERQISMPMRVKGQKVCTYVVDFRITFKNKVQEYVEAKGLPTDVFKMKAKLFAILYTQKLHIVQNHDIKAFIEYLDKRTESNVQYTHVSKHKKKRAVQKVRNASDFLV